jgi:predicted MFS family arabinose efflux permease
LIESSNLGWTNRFVFGSLLAAIACLAAFATIEYRSDFPMVPLALFKNAGFRGANLLTLLLYAAVGIFFFLFPMNLIQVQGYSATEAGAAILPFILLVFLLSRWSGGLVARYGAKKPLIFGPLIAAMGFVLFVVPSVRAGYWETFFPALMMLGLGMAITVAPLTTSVMNSVDSKRIGAASGINNAIARVAGVLGIALFGIVVIVAFRARLEPTLNHLSLSSADLQQIDAQENRLAGLQPPSNLDPQQKAAIAAVAQQGFVLGFRIVMITCAGLSAASSAIAFLMIPNAGVP